MANILDKYNEMISNAVSQNLYSIDNTYANVVAGLKFENQNQHAHGDIPNIVPQEPMHGPPAQSRGEIYLGSKPPSIIFHRIL